MAGDSDPAMNDDDGDGNGGTNFMAGDDEKDYGGADDVLVDDL